MRCGYDDRVLTPAVAKGGTYLSSAISQFSIAADIDDVQGDGAQFDRLTPRQREILPLLAEGHNVKEIADLLQISPKTVETHRAQIM